MLFLPGIIFFAIVFFIILFLATKSMDSNQNSAKYAFFYALSLVALIFTSLSVGMIIFQIINKAMETPVGMFEGVFSSGALRFGLSALIIAAPIYYLVMRYIYGNLATGNLKKDARERVWLTYVILFISSVIMLGWMVATLNNFLNGEITSKFILKALTSVVIAGSIFTFYFYDIRREETAGKNKIIRAYFYGSLFVVIASLAAGLYFNDAPAKVRAKNFDRQVMEQLDQTDAALNSYYIRNKALPESLTDLLKEGSRDIFITDKTIRDPETDKVFSYKILAKDSYEICADFKISSKEAMEEDNNQDYLLTRWAHEAGFQCFTKKAEILDAQGTPIKPIEAR